jgi:hypothetical protein
MTFAVLREPRGTGVSISDVPEIRLAFDHALSSMTIA